MRMFLPMVLVAAAPLPDARAEIMAAMNASAAAWNAGNLARFMFVYADDALYATKNELLRGKPAIAARYRPGFVGDKNLRGRLSFTPLAFRAIGTHRLLVARWSLSGGVKDEQGTTTLLFERQPAGWRIVSDHSS